MKLSVFKEENPADPRSSNNNRGTMVCWDDNYAFGDKQPDESTHSYFRSNIGGRRAVILCLYSTIVDRTFQLSTTQQGAHIGWLYADLKHDEPYDSLEAVLQKELHDYNRWLAGEVYTTKAESHNEN